MTISEKAAAIRKELKNTLGYNSRQVAVKKNNYCAISVRCKVAGLDKASIFRIANKYENIHWDEFNGEILAGGNDYIFVYDETGRSIHAWSIA